MPPARAVPAVPSFSQGLVTSTSQSKTVVKENIRSQKFQTGWEYTVTGSGIEPVSGVVNPPAKRKGLDLKNATEWKQSVPGAAFQYAETYSPPGLIEKIAIDRETIIETVTDSMSTFTE